jgi:ligand-binding sensor domain-containing protein
MSSLPDKSAPIFLVCIFLHTIVSAQVIQRLTADRFTHYDFDDWISYAPALNITSIDMDDNYIYFASSPGGILRYNKYQNYWDYPFTTSNGLSSNRIKLVIYSAADRMLYAVSRRGIDTYKPAEKFWRPAQQNTIPPRIEPDAVELEGIEPGKDYRFPPYFRPDNSFLPNFFTDIYLTYHLDGTIYDHHNREFKINDRLVDSWQRLWIGSNGMGPLKADLYTWRLESMPQSLPFISPRDIFLRADQIWIGGINNDKSIGGITLWTTNDNRWQYFEAQYLPQLYKDDVVAIDGNKDYIVFGTLDGVAIFIPAKNRWLTLNSQAGLESDQVHDVLVHGDTVYVASEFGFNWINLNSMKVYESRQTILDHVRINQLTYKDSLIWAAARLGLYSIDVRQDLIIYHPSHAAMVDYNLTAIETIADEIWMANQNGIAYWDQRRDEWHSFPNLDMQLLVRDIAHTNDYVWFATDKGLLKYDRPRNYWRIFTEKDGLLSTDTYHIDPREEYLWITTAKGITRFRWWSEDRID